MTRENESLRSALRKNLSARAQARISAPNGGPAQEKNENMAKKSKKRLATKDIEDPVTAPPTTDSAAEKNGGAEKKHGASDAGLTKLDLAAYRKNLATAASVNEISRKHLADLLGVASARLASVEKEGAAPAEFHEKLQELEKSVRSGEIPIKARARGRPAGGAAKHPKPTSGRRGRPKRDAAKSADTGPAIDVKQLRASMGLSGAAFAKLIGASIGSVGNWERGTTPNSKYMPKLQELQTRVASGEFKPAEGVAAPKKRGRPPKAAKPLAAAASGPISERLALVDALLAMARNCSPDTADKLRKAAGALLGEG